MSLNKQRYLRSRTTSLKNAKNAKIWSEIDILEGMQ